MKFSAWFPNQKRGSNKLGSISKKHLRFWMFIWSNLDSWPFEVPPRPIKRAYNEFTVLTSSASASEWIKILLVSRKATSHPHEWYQCPVKETPESSHAPSAQSRHSKKDDCLLTRKQAFTRHQISSILVLNSPASRTMRKQCLLLKLPSLWYSVIVAQTH